MQQGFGLSILGFKRKSYIEIIQDMIERAKDLFGEDIETSDRSPLGLYIQSIAWEKSKIWDELENVYFSAFIDYAEGKQLDALVKYIGIFRRPALHATGQIEITGTPEKAIPQGLIVRTENGQQFATENNVTLDENGESTVWVRALVAGGRNGNVTAGRIDRLLHPQQGITSIHNPRHTSGGLEIESDEDLRERYYRSLQRKGKATRAAIEAAIIELPTVRDALVLENVTMETDEHGIPPKSVAPFVFDGDPIEIVRAILETKSAGIQSYGDIVIDTIDSRGFPQKIGYTKASYVGVNVEVTVFRNTRFRVNYEQELRTNIIRYIGGIDHDGTEHRGLGLGQAIVHSRIVAITADRGIDDVVVKISIDGGETWHQNNINMPTFQIAVTNYSKVMVI